jgi:hypothetical protein
VTLTTARSPAAGNLLITTFDIAYTPAPKIQITPKNASAASLMTGGYCLATSTTT